ncbi:hypothetical protein AA309_23885 [Microvirga vignae]|uniref:Uncharacterized protein n=1 Tax=Microvirga vignae TaxID=1225564 RepID=A0A0H1R6F6_9HYPH|nr:hypothetical protein AA309_23885 [Microvirga vignae]
MREATMKRPGDMKRRQQAAYRKGWNDAMDALDLRIEVLRRDGHLSDEAPAVPCKPSSKRRRRSWRRSSRKAATALPRGRDARLLKPNRWNRKPGLVAGLLSFRGLCGWGS